MEGVKQIPKARQPRAAAHAGGQNALAAPAAGKRKSPAEAMQADTAFQGEKAKVGEGADHQKMHEPAAKKAAEGQAAASAPANEREGKAKDRQAAGMDRQQPGVFNEAAFKAALQAKIQQLHLNTLKEAEDFKKNKGAESLKGNLSAQVNNEKEAAAGPVADKVKEAPDPSKEQSTPPGPQPAAAPPVQQPVVSGQPSAPKPAPDADISLKKESQELDTQMKDAKITDGQLTKGNEAKFSKAVDSKKNAQKNAAEAPPQFRKSEASIITQAQAAATGLGKTHLNQMAVGRNKHMSAVLAKQMAAKAKDEENRKKVADAINQKFDITKKEVELMLSQLDKNTNQAFDDGIAEATRQFEDYVDKHVTDFKIKRYLVEVGGSIKWAADLLMGPPEEINNIYKEGKNRYVVYMDGVIGKVARQVAAGLNAAKSRISAGKQEIQTYVNGLPQELQKAGQQAARDISSKFGELEQSVDNKQQELIDSLADKYKAGLENIDKKIEEMKEANKGFIDQAKGFISDVINMIIELKNMLLNVLARASAAIDLIIEDPIAFLGHLVDGVKMGIKRFVSNIGAHLKAGLMGWLFGTLAAAGIEVPKSFDLKGILSLILQVLGLTYANIRSRAVNIVGEKVVAGLEQAAEIFLIIKNEGIGGLWKFIKDKVADLKETVMSSIKEFIIQKIVVAGVTWLISLLNPASAFVKACKMIYDVIMFFVQRGKQIMDLVNAVINSVMAIAKGAINVAADAVEGALAKALPVAISFLASLLGLDGISEKIKTIIAKIQAPVNAAIDWVIHKAVALVKGVAGLLKGTGKKKDEPGKKGDEHSPEKKVKIAKGLSMLHEEQQRYKKDGKISKKDADRIVMTVKTNHPVFSGFWAREKGKKILFVYAASPETVDNEMDNTAGENALLPEPLKVHSHIKYKKGAQQEREGNKYVIHSINTDTLLVYLMADDGYVKKPMPVDQFVQQGKNGDYKLVTPGEMEQDLVPMDVCIIIFKYNDLPPTEYNKQLKLQERGINATTVDNWFSRKDQYEGRNKDSAAAQKRARDDEWQQWKKIVLARLRQEYRAMSGNKMPDKPTDDKMEADASKLADDYLSGKAALHAADQIAGGHFKGLTGLGLSRVNSSIGSQWAKVGPAGMRRDAQLLKHVTDYKKTRKFDNLPKSVKDQSKMKVNLNAE